MIGRLLLNPYYGGWGGGMYGPAPQPQYPAGWPGQAPPQQPPPAPQYAPPQYAAPALSLFPPAPQYAALPAAPQYGQAYGQAYGYGYGWPAYGQGPPPGQPDQNPNPMPGGQPAHAPVGPGSPSPTAPPLSNPSSPPLVSPHNPNLVPPQAPPPGAPGTGRPEQPIPQAPPPGSPGTVPQGLVAISAADLESLRQRDAQFSTLIYQQQQAAAAAAADNERRLIERGQHAEAFRSQSERLNQELQAQRHWNMQLQAQVHDAMIDRALMESTDGYAFYQPNPQSPTARGDFMAAIRGDLGVVNNGGRLEVRHKTLNQPVDQFVREQLSSPSKQFYLVAGQRPAPINMGAGAIQPGQGAPAAMTPTGYPMPENPGQAAYLHFLQGQQRQAQNGDGGFGLTPEPNFAAAVPMGPGAPYMQPTQGYAQPMPGYAQPAPATFAQPMQPLRVAG